MKKYVKPDLFYENFELSQSVASCRVEGDDTKLKTNNTNGNACTYDLGGAMVFNSGNNQCLWDYSILEGYCYQSGAGSYNLFSS